MTGELAANPLPSHEALLAEAFAAVTECVFAISDIDERLKLLQPVVELGPEVEGPEEMIPLTGLEKYLTSLDPWGDSKIPTVHEREMDGLFAHHDRLMQHIAELQRKYRRALFELSPQLSDVEYCGGAAFLYGLNPYLLDRADSFRQQVSERVGQLGQGEPLVVWGENSQTRWGVQGGRIVEVRRLPPSPTDDLGIEIVFQPQHPTSQEPIVARRSITKLLDSRTDEGQLRLGWYATPAEIATLACEVSKPNPIRLKDQQVQLNSRVETLAQVVIAAHQADVDLFAADAFAAEDKTRMVEEFSRLFLTTRAGDLRWLAIDSLEILGTWTTEFSRTLTGRLVGKP